MTCSIYTGLQGSGKSFECVRGVILPAVAAGRRVVSNIDGLNEEAILKMASEMTGKAPQELGSVRYCTDDETTAPGFFPHGKDRGDGTYVYRNVVDGKVEWLETTNSIVQPGDLVCMDEGWRFCSKDAKVSDEHFQFFRMHRHYVDKSGVSCDLVIMTQHITDLHRKLVAATRYSFLCKKFDAIGATKRYRVTMWEGCNHRLQPLNTEIRKYDPRIFPLYSSYGGGAQGKEIRTDSRTNVLKSWKLKALGVLFIAFIAIGAYGIKAFMGLSSPESLGIKDKKASASPGVPNRAEGGTLPGQGGGAPGAPVPGQQTFPPQQSANANMRRIVAPPRPPAPPRSSTWRIAGMVSTPEGKAVLIVSREGATRRIDPSSFTFKDERPERGEVEGEVVTAFWQSGSSWSSMGQGAQQQPPVPTFNPPAQAPPPPGASQGAQASAAP